MLNRNDDSSVEELLTYPTALRSAPSELNQVQILVSY